MYDAFVFDLDGTLWDASEACSIGWNEGLRSLKLNRRVTAQDIRSVTGKPTAQCIEILFPDELLEYDNLFSVLCQYEEYAIKETGGTLYENVSETLDALSRKADLFLVSNCKDWYLQTFFDLSGLGKFFKDSTCHGISNKEKPEMLLDLREKHDLANPIYVGDTLGDEQSAKRAGYAFAFAGYGFGQAIEPDTILQSPSDLVLLNRQILDRKKDNLP